MNTDRSDAPARPALGSRRAWIQFAVAAAVIAIFLYVAWATMISQG